jgi:hypothetical protein
VDLRAGLVILGKENYFVPAHNQNSNRPASSIHAVWVSVTNCGIRHNI